MPSLAALVNSEHDVLAVVTNPDRPAGRGYELKPPPVKLAALEAGLEVHQPEKARDPSFISWVGSMAPDVCVVVAYGKILPKDLLDVPAKGFVNLHFSLLPAYRGAAPVQRAVMDGNTETGVSVMVLTEGMDEGPVLAEMRVPIEPDESAGVLGERLAELGAPLLTETLGRYGRGEIVPVEQDHGAATYAPKISNEEARIDWTFPATKVGDLIRGLNPVPGAWTTFRGDRVKVFAVQIAGGAGRPGEILDATRPIVACGSGALELVRVQPAGKRAMDGADFCRGARPLQGEHFE